MTIESGCDSHVDRARVVSEHRKVMFLPFFCGMVPQFPTFFLRALEVYWVHLVHLTPNVGLTLVIFSHLYGMFVDVRPFFKPFEYLFLLQSSGFGFWVVGFCCSN